MGGWQRGTQFTKCYNCGYRWTWASKTHCHQCRKYLNPMVPAVAVPRSPEGAWATGAGRGGGGAGKHVQQLTPAGIVSAALDQLKKIGGGDTKEAKAMEEQLAALRAQKEAAFEPWKRLQSKQQQLEKAKKKLAATKEKLEQQEQQLRELCLSISDQKRTMAALTVEVQDCEAAVARADLKQQQRKEGKAVGQILSLEVADLHKQLGVGQENEAVTKLLAAIAEVKTLAAEKAKTEEPNPEKQSQPEGQEGDYEKEADMAVDSDQKAAGDEEQAPEGQEAGGARPRARRPTAAEAAAAAATRATENEPLEQLVEAAKKRSADMAEEDAAALDALIEALAENKRRRQG